MPSKLISSTVAGSLLLALAATSALAAPRAARTPYGVAKSGEAVEVFTLINDHGVSVRVLSYGAIIDQILVPDRQGKAANVVLSLPDLAAYEANGAFNSVVGRFANRIAGGGFTLDGVRYALPANAKGVAMHGGPKGFGAKVWRGEAFSKAGAAGVVLTYVSPDGENGYPGALTTQITYTLTDHDEVRIAYQATTDKPTIINLTNHTYFNLAGAGVIYDHDLQVLASRWTPTDDNQIPTGEIASVQGTPFDLRRPVRIGDRVTSTHPQMVLAKGYDHNFVLDKPAGDPLPVAVRVHDPKSGRRLEVRTSEPGVQVYTGNNLNGAVVGANGTLRQSAGLALETEHFPDSPNKPSFPSTVLRPGEVWRSTTVLRFSADPR